MEDFSQYAHAFVALGAMVLLVIVLTGSYGLAKGKTDLQSGEAPSPDYQDPIYRAYRAMINAQEGLVLFTAALVAAIGAGAHPFSVNLLASVYLLARLAMAYIHIKGIGKMEGGPRSMAYAVGIFTVTVLAVLGIMGAFL